jgi:hypothetical protein
MGILDKKIELYCYVGNSNYEIDVKSQGSKKITIKSTAKTVKATSSISFADIGIFEHTGKFEMIAVKGIKERNILLDRYAEIAPTTGNLGSSNMKVMLETTSIINKNEAISYGFHDAGTSRAHRAYIHVTDNHENWMGDLLNKRASLVSMPLNIFALPGSHDAGMYKLYIPAGQIIGMLVTNEVKNLIKDPVSKVMFKILAEAVAGGIDDKTGMETRILTNLAITQKDTITYQLRLGTRYFDFRPGHHLWDKNSELCHQHNFIPGCSLKEFLSQIRDFLLSHPQEIVVTQFSKSGFSNKDLMKPKGTEVRDLISKIIEEAGIGKGNSADLDQPYGKLLMENKRFIVLDKEIESTWKKENHYSTKPNKILKNLDDLVNNNSQKLEEGCIVQVQGTASGLTPEIIKSSLSFSDASSPLLYTKPYFDSETYPWINKNYKKFPNEQPLIFLNDFVDNQLVEMCCKISLSRIKTHESVIHPEDNFGFVGSDFLKFYGDHVFKENMNIPFDYNFNSISNHELTFKDEKYQVVPKLGNTREGKGKYDDGQYTEVTIVNESNDTKLIEATYRGSHMTIDKYEERLNPGMSKTLRLDSDPDFEIRIKSKKDGSFDKYSMYVDLTFSLCAESSFKWFQDKDSYKKTDYYLALSTANSTKHMEKSLGSSINDFTWWFMLKSSIIKLDNIDESQDFMIDFSYKKPEIFQCSYYAKPHSIAELKSRMPIKIVIKNKPKQR